MSYQITNILVVDDEPAIISVLHRLLGQKKEFNVDTALNSSEAMEVLDRTSIDIMISDIRMPEMSGIELIKQSLSLDPELQCIVLTGHADIDTAIEAMRAGAINYLKKPFNFEELFIAINLAVEKKQLLKENRQYQQELEVAYRDLDQIFNVAVPLCLVSGECRITRVNQSFCEYFHVSDKEVLETTCFDFWACDLFETDNCSLNQLKKGKKLCQRQLDRNVKEKRFFCSIHSVPRYDTAGCFIGMISTFFDMADVKKAQDALMESQKQLRQVEKLRAIGTLSGSIAHEFNNPLCGIINVLNRIDRKIAPQDKDKVLLQMAQTECERMKRMTRDLQDFNRPSSGQKSDFDPHKSIDDLLLFSKKELQRKKVNVIRQYTSRPGSLNAVQDQITQVLLNLLQNAVAALPAEGGTITIRTDRRDQDFIIFFHDNGEGIAPENMEHIFEPFFTTKSAVKGIGLGLSVSYGIIESHNGKISVESELGKGTTLTIILPI